MGLKLTTPRLRVTCPMDWASQAPKRTTFNFTYLPSIKGSKPQIWKRGIPKATECLHIDGHRIMLYMSRRAYAHPRSSKQWSCMSKKRNAENSQKIFGPGLPKEKARCWEIYTILGKSGWVEFLEKKAITTLSPHWFSVLPNSSKSGAELINWGNALQSQDTDIFQDTWQCLIRI